MSRDGRPSLVRELLRPFVVVVVLGVVLVGVTGVWPPMVAVESGSMGPHIEKGDLVVVTEPSRWTATATSDSGVVTARRADGYRRFGGPGDVIVFDTPEWEGSPIIHRAQFHVEAGENWYGRADRSYLPADVDDCTELLHCPAPHAGYITKGDANPHYDQAHDRVAPVRTQWIRSKGGIRVPELGWVRLFLSGKATFA
ncbi:signal peptidase, endoplasmic reticulum-type [Halogranum amylolyticum]|uniref:Signal peptidase, endoplasmic reticulum-type n=1 Tax=Halogranum amylolyticum TaxID=660520 RepID=A0A1H8NA39_9EURY|nr:S26 family signal peptidase [Halogranum amylolyticum]SEO26465.1 signal peptidase, endoplasmic reticulum-type [Halogranum amylolyticum]